MTPNPKFRELIMSMGIIPEDEHYDVAEAIMRECMTVVSKKCASPTAYEALVEHFGVEE